MKYKRVSVFGAGLIGGAVGLDLKKLGLASEVLAWGRNPERLQEALNAGAADTATTDLEEACRGSEIILLSVPPEAIVKLLGVIPEYLDKGTLVIDAGSVKREIVDSATRLIQNSKATEFVGSHPMAGSDKTGVNNSYSGMFRGAPCIITPSRKNTPLMVDKAEAFWRALGMNVIRMSPEEHDLTVGLLSHLPHAVSSALVRSIYSKIGDPERVSNAAGPSYYDMTRVAASPASMWAEIYRANSENLIEAVDIIRKELLLFREALLSERREELTEYLSGASSMKEKL